MELHCKRISKEAKSVNLIKLQFLSQLDIRGCDNQVRLEGSCSLIQYGGSDNVTRWKQRPGAKPPRVERTGWNNLFETIP